MGTPYMPTQPPASVAASVGCFGSLADEHAQSVGHGDAGFTAPAVGGSPAGSTSWCRPGRRVRGSRTGGSSSPTPGTPGLPGRVLTCRSRRCCPGSDTAFRRRCSGHYEPELIRKKLCAPPTKSRVSRTTEEPSLGMPVAVERRHQAAGAGDAVAEPGEGSGRELAARHCDADGSPTLIDHDRGGTGVGIDPAKPAVAIARVVQHGEVRAEGQAGDWPSPRCRTEGAGSGRRRDSGTRCHSRQPT